MAFTPNKRIVFNSTSGYAYIDFAMSTFQMDQNDIVFSYKYNKFSQTYQGQGYVDGVNSLKWRITASYYNGPTGIYDVVTISSRSNKIRPVIIELMVPAYGSTPSYASGISWTNVDSQGNINNSQPYPVIEYLSKFYPGQNMRAYLTNGSTGPTTNSKLRLTQIQTGSTDSTNPLYVRDKYKVEPINMNNPVFYKGYIRYEKAYHVQGQDPITYIRQLEEMFKVNASIPYTISPVGGVQTSVDEHDQKGVVVIKLLTKNAVSNSNFSFKDDVGQVHFKPIFDDSTPNFVKPSGHKAIFIYNNSNWTGSVTPNTNDFNNSDKIDMSWDLTTGEVTFTFTCEVPGVKGYEITFLASKRNVTVDPINVYYNFNAKYEKPEVVPPADLISSFQPSITVQDGLMKEVVLSPSKPVLKTDRLVEDVLRITENDVDSQGNLIEIDLEFIQDQLKQLLGVGSNANRPSFATGAYATKFQSKILNSTSVNNSSDITMGSKPNI